MEIFTFTRQLNSSLWHWHSYSSHFSVSSKLLIMIHTLWKSFTKALRPWSLIYEKREMLTWRRQTRYDPFMSCSSPPPAHCHNLVVVVVVARREIINILTIFTTLSSTLPFHIHNIKIKKRLAMVTSSDAIFWSIVGVDYACLRWGCWNSLLLCILVLRWCLEWQRYLLLDASSSCFLRR